MTLDHSALWSMYASLEELRGKIGHVLKCAIQMSKVAWSNVIAKRCELGLFSEAPKRRSGAIESPSLSLLADLPTGGMGEVASLSPGDPPQEDVRVQPEGY